MRKEWFQYVAKVRAQQTRKNKKPCSHREAMRLASCTWEKQKQKILRKRKREAAKARKISKLAEPTAENPKPE